jgi:hypothetical protein
MAVNVLRVADRVAGSAIERLTQRSSCPPAGQARALRAAHSPDDDSLWAAGDPPSRAGNALDMLIEGAAYFPALEQL